MDKFKYTNEAVTDLIINSLNCNDEFQKNADVEYGDADGELVLRLNGKRFRIHVEGD
jgi:hypothetical protein